MHQHVPCTPCSHMQVIHDRDGRSKGFGFVTFNSYVGMQAAITKVCLQR